MLRNKQYLYIAIFIMLVSALSYLFSLVPASKQQIKIQLLWQNDVLDCQSTFMAGENNKTWFVEQLQFFIHDIQFGSNETGWEKVNLVDNFYQTGGSVLLGKNCQQTQLDDSVDSTGNWQVEFYSDANITANSRMKFTLGLPFESNHLNPISQKSPLNLPSMFWVWQTGHKFMRLELASSNEQWLFHLGSTGCQSASVMRAPNERCRNPNLFHFEVPAVKNNGKQYALNLNLAELLDKVTLNSSSSCQSARDNESCQQLFRNLSKTNSATEAVGVFNAVNTKHFDRGVNVE